MTRFNTGRVAACGGALVLAIGAGSLAAPAANADTGLGLTRTLNGVVSSTGLTGTPTAVPVVAPVATTVQNLTGSTTPAVTATTPATPGAVQQILDYLSTTTGTGALAGTSTSAGGVTLTVGDDGRGASVVAVSLGGERTTTVGGTGTAGADGKDGADGGSTTSGSTDTGTTAGLLGLQIRRSLATVYPVKDGYRDQVAFTLDGLTTNGQPQALNGLAVLKRGGAVVKRWTLTRSDQVLQWNGLSGAKLVAGDYRLLVGVQDAAGRGFGAATAAKVSAKRLVASTQRVKALSVSGTHTMATAPRKGLSRGTVTVRVTTVATKVRGHAQKLIFEKGGKRLVVRIKKGTHTSRPITIPASFTSYRIKHTWKKGQVRLKSIKYTYSYQSLK